MRNRPGKQRKQLTHARGVRLRFIQPGEPLQNACIESFNGRLRDDCPNQHWFLGERPPLVCPTSVHR